jgi:hypothetical protein
MTETGASRLAFVTSWRCWSAFGFCVLAAVLRVATFNRASRDSSAWSALGSGGVECVVTMSKIARRSNPRLFVLPGGGNRDMTRSIL